MNFFSIPYENNLLKNHIQQLKSQSLLPVVTSKQNSSLFDLLQMHIERESCQLLGTFGIFVQVVLGIFCFSTLMLKQLPESSRRPWKIWIFDTSKQAFGSAYMHTINVLFAQFMLVQQQKQIQEQQQDNENIYNQQQEIQQDACSWYFVNYLCDVVFCTILNFILVQIMIKITKNLETFKFNPGVYGEDTKIGLYFYQLFIWIVIISIDKMIMIKSVIFFQEYLTMFGHFLLGGLAEYPHIELVIVMVIVPSIMNSLCFWITDSYLRNNNNDSKQNEILNCKQKFTEKQDIQEKQNKINRKSQQNQKQEKNYNYNIKNCDNEDEDLLQN